MKNFSYCIRRIERSDRYEHWLLYVSKDNSDLYEDDVVLFFKDNNFKVVLITHDSQQLKNEQYGTVLESIYHDIGVLDETEVQYELEVKKIPENLLLESEDEIDDYITEIISEIKEKFKE